MRVRIAPMYKDGRPIVRDEFKKQPYVEGELTLVERKDFKLGRVTKIASLTDRDTGFDHILLNDLFDVEVLAIGTGFMTMRGCERIKSAEIAQTWHVLVE